MPHVAAPPPTADPEPNGDRAQGTRSTRGRLTHYEIRNEAGHVEAVHVREDLPDGDKRFWWQRPDGTLGLGGRAVTDLPLYGIDDLAKVPLGGAVVITEGEKARHALKERGIPAVATVTGAKTTPRPEAFRPLLNRRVVLWADNDNDGEEHMRLTVLALRQIGHTDVRRLAWPEAPPAGDAFDFFARGGTVEQARALIHEAAPERTACSSWPRRP